MSGRALLLAAVLVLGGCAGRFQAAELDGALGQWTKADVLARFGSPAERDARDGEESWIYSESYPVTLGSPYQPEPSDPAVVGGGVRVGQELRPAPAGGFELRRRFRLGFDRDGILRRWEELR